MKTINQNPVTTTYIEDTSVNTGTVTSMDLSATTVNSDSVLTLVFSTAAGASATNRLIIYFRSIDSSGTSGNPHEDGYCGSAFDNDASRTCSVVDSSERFVSCKCDSKAKILWMDLNDGASVNIPTNTAVTYKFVDLKIPSSVPIIKDTIQFILIESQDV